MNNNFAIAQVIGLLGLYFSLKAYFQNEKDDYATNCIIGAIINIIHYLMLDAYSGVVTKVVALIREILVYISAKHNTKNSIYMYIFITVIYIILCIFTYNGNILNLLPLLAAIIYFTFEWFGTLAHIRKIGLITGIMWMIYNIYVFSIPGIIYNLITITCLIIVIIKKDNPKSI